MHIFSVHQYPWVSQEHNSMPLCYQKILPATTSRRLEHPRWSEKKRQEEPESGRRKSKAIKIACQMCKRRKVKCDGQRPECAPCAGRKAICRYDFDAAENTTRYQALNKKHRDLEQMLRHHLKLLDLLRQQPYDEAIDFLG